MHSRYSATETRRFDTLGGYGRQEGTKEVDGVNTAIKLAGFVLGITVVFFAAYLIGTAVGPVGDQAPATHEHAQVVNE